jgi:hypothetical protein
MFLLSSGWNEMKSGGHGWVGGWSAHRTGNEMMERFINPQSLAPWFYE